MRAIVLACLLAAGSVMAQQRPAGSSPLFSKGVDAYRKAQFPEAASIFRQILTANPSQLNARLYLGLTLMAQFRPGDQSPANLDFAKQADQQLRALLDFDPENKQGLFALGNLTMLQAMGSVNNPVERQQRLEEAAEAFRSLNEVDPWNRDALYNYAFVLWQLAEPAFSAARAGTQPPTGEGERLRDPAAQAALKKKYGGMINDAIEALDRCIGLDPSYAAPYTQLSSFYKLRASLAMDDSAHQKDLQSAKTSEKRTEARGIPLN